jgi:hypothetical protein
MTMKQEIKSQRNSASINIDKVEMEFFDQLTGLLNATQTTGKFMSVLSRKHDILIRVQTLMLILDN